MVVSSGSEDDGQAVALSVGANTVAATTGQREVRASFGRERSRRSLQVGERAVLRVETRDVGSAESGVVDEVRRMERRRVGPDVGTAESPAMCDRKRIHAIGRNKRECEPGTVC